MLKGFALIALILFGGDIGARAAETIRITNGEWQPFLSKDVLAAALAAIKGCRIPN